ncbi:MAG: hypothetical protein AB7I41_02685 [Candidatus Sericytochromatia bacterium]
MKRTMRGTGGLNAHPWPPTQVQNPVYEAQHLLPLALTANDHSVQPPAQLKPQRELVRVL